MEDENTILTGLECSSLLSTSTGKLSAKIHTYYWDKKPFAHTDLIFEESVDQIERITNNG